MPLIPENQRPPFRLVSEEDFGPVHLDEYPVWSEFYDHAERNEIVAWGIDAAWLDAELAAYHTGNAHPVYPLWEVNPFPPRMRIFIRAQFKTAAGQELHGYIVNEDAHPAIAIFYGSETFYFNRLLCTDGEQEAAHLRAALPDSSDPIFPLRYEADFTDTDGEPIAGTFDFVEGTPY
jgi:hypothetical protein